MKYVTESGRQYTGGELARMAMHGDAIERDGEIYVNGERLTPLDEEHNEE